MTAADQWMMKYQNYALNASRYNLLNAETVTQYQAANLMHQQALQTLMQTYSMNYRNNKYGNSGYGVGLGRPTSYGSSGSNDQAKAIPADKLFSKDGQVLWPLGAPEDGDLKAKKQAASAAIQKAISDYIASNAAPPVREVVAARKALSDYANPAARELKDQRPDDYDAFVNYIQNLDGSLRSLADVAHNGAGTARHRPAPAETTGGINVDPKTLPKAPATFSRRRWMRNPRSQRPSR